MPIHSTINRDVGIIEEAWIGAITIDDLKSYWQNYLLDPEVLGLRRILVDLRAAEIKFKGLELDDLVQQFVVPKLNGLDWKTAIVTDKPIQYGVSRQHQVFAERYSKDAIFYDYTEARAWLIAP